MSAQPGSSNGRGFPGRRLWALLLVAPLTVPLFVTSYAWATLGVALQGFVGAAGIIAFSYYPIVFLLVAVALRGLDPALEDSARSLGLNPRQVFFRVILPQLRPALLGGLLLVALDALVEFDAFVALRFQTFSLDIYAQYRLGFSTSGAAALSFFSIVLCLVLLFGEARLRGDANYTSVSRGARRPPVRYELGRWTLPVLASLAAVVVVRRRHPGRHAHPLVHGEQQRRALDRNGEPPVSLAGQSHDDSARCLLRPGGAAPRAAGCAARGPARGALCEARRTLDVPLLRAARPRGGDRALLRSRFTTRGSSTGASR